MKRLFISLTFCLLFLLASCKVETVSEHEKKIVSSTVSSEEVLEETPSEVVSDITSENITEVKNESSTVAESSAPVKNNTKKTESAVPEISSEEVKNTLTVTFSIECTQALGVTENVKLPANGYFIENKNVEINDGETVFDVMQRICKCDNISIDFTGKAKLKTVYIRGIGGLYEKDCGGNSGWKYEVNGQISSMGCSAFILHGGENIHWYYATGVNE